MSKHSQSLFTVFGAVLISVLAATGRADVTVTQNIAFTATGKNPWGPGNALEVSKSYTLLDVPYTHVDIPPINADPLGVAMDSLSSALGVPLPSLAKLQVGGSASGSAHVGFDFFASLGRLNINYPARSNLNVQTISGGNYVQANQSYSIGSGFEPGVSNRDIPQSQAIQIGGVGYSEPILGGVSYTSYSTPRFATTAPWAEAKLEATADVHAGAYVQLSVLGGLKKWRADYNFGGPVGGPIIEIDPSGLYVAGQDTHLFNLTQPITVSLQFGTATVTYPKLGLSGTQNANTPVLHGENVSEVFRIDTDLEKLIPFIGTVLHNSFPPLTYDLLHIKGGPVLSVYQDQTFTPEPQVRLWFSEPVFVEGQAISVKDIPLGTTISWSPMFNNSSQVTIVPQYILNNTFHNETGIDVSVQFDVDAISLTAPFIPPYTSDSTHTIGPLINPPPTNISLGRIALLNSSWEIPVSDVTGAAITIPKLNVDQVANRGDLQLTLAQLVSGTPGSGNATYELHFNRSVVGGPPQEFQATMAGIGSLVHTPNGDSYVDSGVFKAAQDVILTDPDTSQPFNVGRDFCLSGCGLSQYQPEPGPAFIADDPNNPGQFLPPMYVPNLPVVPNTDVDPTIHPILKEQDMTHTNGVANVQYGTDAIDLRNGPTTTILARTKEFNPEGNAQFNAFNFAAIGMNDDGGVAFTSTLAVFSPGGSTLGYYYADETGKAKLAHSGDPIPGGDGTINLSFGISTTPTNNLGQGAFVAAISNSSSTAGVFRSGPAGLTLIARLGQLTPDGQGTFNSFPIFRSGLNDVGQVTFLTQEADALNQSKDGIYRGDGNVLTKIVREGDPAPGFAGSFVAVDANFNNVNRVINNSGQVVFVGYANTGHGLYVGNGNTPMPIARTGGAAPQGGQFSGFYENEINEAGQVAFTAGLAPFDSTFGIFRGDGVSTVQIAREGQLAPDGDGTLKNSLFRFQMNDAGQVAINGRVDAATDYQAVFLGDGGNLTQIARGGMIAPGGNEQFTLFAGVPQINNQGHVAFEGVVANTPDDGRGVYLYDGTNLVPVVHPGQPLAGSIALGATLVGINDDMQVAYRVSLADGRSVIARFEPSLYWHNAGSGSWATASNWSLNVEPINPYDVFIVAENPLTVTGPPVNRTVKSLTIGGDDTSAATLNLLSGTMLTATNGTTIRANGVLSGLGAISGNLTSSGSIRPAGSVNTTTMTLSGNLHLENGSKLELDLRGTTPGTLYDQLAISGAATLDGELAISLFGFTPQLNNTLQILTATGGVSGQFDMTVTDLPVLTDNLGWRLTYLATSVNLSVVIATPGDFSANGIVGPEDYLVWRANYGSTTKLSADANHNGIVDATDYVEWRHHLGQTAGGGSGSGPNTAVPEPSMLVMLVLAVVGVCSRRRRAA